LKRKKERYYYLDIIINFLKYYRILNNNVDLNLIADKPMGSLTEEFDEATMLIIYINFQAVCLSTINSNSAIKLVS